MEEEKQNQQSYPADREVYVETTSCQQTMKNLTELVALYIPPSPRNLVSENAS
jgi:hypothetical protein